MTRPIDLLCPSCGAEPGAYCNESHRGYALTGHFHHAARVDAAMSPKPMLGRMVSVESILASSPVVADLRAALAEALDGWENWMCMALTGTPEPGDRDYAEYQRIAELRRLVKP